jgi:L-ascorbate metabolism protein UlaG (beta-lactamase superfamily)
VPTPKFAGSRLDRIELSPQWRDGRFHNRRTRVDGPILHGVWKFAFGGSPNRKPSAPIPTVARVRGDYDAPPASGLRVTWLGHSTTLLEIGGRRVLIDPVYSERASPLPRFGPRRFYPSPLPIDELPAFDVVLLSHDHADHLDPAAIRTLSARGAHFIAPLGVGARLDAWGVPGRDIEELDWWDSTTVAGLTLTATPARHFSGRSINDRDRTLWAGWVIASERHRVLYSGDSALDDAFIEIGERLGPFDLTMIEIGAYDALWPDVHLGPEQAVRAHRLAGGDVMLPVHWGLFDLALHGWTEPIERVLAAARTEGVRVITPRPGELAEPATFGAPERWWPELPWRSAEEAPVQSTGVAHLMAPSFPVLARA